MVKLQDQVKFVDDMGKSFTGIVVKINNDETLNIKVKRKIGHGPQVFIGVPKEIKDQKNKLKPRYMELSSKKETPKKKQKVLDD